MQRCGYTQFVKIGAEHQKMGAGLDLFLVGDGIDLLFERLVINDNDRKLLSVIAGRRVADRIVDLLHLLRFDLHALVTADRPPFEQRFLYTFHDYRFMSGKISCRRRS